jgi:hypothetical protein
MKKLSLIACAAVIAAIGYAVIQTHSQPDNDGRSSREAYEAMLRDHAFTKILNTPAPEEEGEREESEGDNPDRAMLQNFLMTMDPELLRPTPWVLREYNLSTAKFRDYEKNSEFAQATSLATGTSWTERGPKQVGGRTRALMFDPNDANKRKVWAGGVSGGLWVNTNITDANTAWQKVDDFWDNLAVTCIAADPINSQIFYVGTGEGWFNADAVTGAGIWKTTNGGTSWTQLASTISYTFVNDIVVRNEGGVGVVYAGVQNSSVANNGLFRSANGGTSWTQVLPASINNESVTDIEIGKDNKLYVGARSKIGGSAAIYLSTHANGAVWTTQNYPSFDGRVEIACSPSSELVAYVVFENDNEVGSIKRTSDGGTNWTEINTPVDADLGIPADDFSRGQAWYDLVLTVHPTDPNICLVGAIDIFSTVNGGTSWSQISKWSNNSNLNTLNCSLVHADQHNIVFRPGFPNEIIVGNDGGVYYCTNITNAATTNVFSSRNLNYNVTQFYSAALHPSNSNFMLGGTQDNGTQKFTLTGFDNTVNAMGGDGGMCFIDQLNPQFQIGSFTGNNYRLSTDGGATFSTLLIDDDATGNFINQGDYDSNLKILYTGKSSTEIYRVTNVTTTRNLTSLPISLGSSASAFRVSPHATTVSNLYVGTMAGKLFKIANAQAASISPVEITGPLFPGGAISSIAFGASESQILVTFSNYGVNSVWETRNGGTTWTSREGNLPNMPIRWAEYHPQNFDQVYLATELGVWSSDNINVASPVWTSTNGGLANVRTDMLRVRKSDGMIMAATHGRGVFTAVIPSNLDQTITFNTITGTKTFGDPTFKLSAKSTSGLPITFLSSNPAVVTIADSTVTIVGAGSVQISATQPGNTYYAAATPQIQNLTINKANQTITFGALTEQDIDDPDFTLSATATSGLPVSYASSNAAVATVVGSTLSINGPGTATITASQSGNTNFNAATAVPQTLTVVTRVISLTGTLNFGEVFIGQSPELTFTISTSGTGGLNVTNIVYPDGYSGESEVVGNAIEVTVTFEPDDEGDFNGNIQVVSNATSGTSTIAVSGTAVLITSAEGDLDMDFTVYPNPATGQHIKIRSANTPPKKVTFVDMSGKEWEEVTIPENENTVQVDISKLTTGTYIVKIPSANGYARKQIVKK